MQLTHEMINELLRDVTAHKVVITSEAKDFMRVMWKTTKRKGPIELSDKQAGFYKSLRADADLVLITQRGESNGSSC